MEHLVELRFQLTPKDARCWGHTIQFSTFRGGAKIDALASKSSASFSIPDNGKEWVVSWNVSIATKQWDHFYWSSPIFRIWTAMAPDNSKKWTRTVLHCTSTTDCSIMPKIDFLIRLLISLLFSHARIVTHCTESKWPIYSKKLWKFFSDSGNGLPNTKENEHSANNFYELFRFWAGSLIFTPKPTTPTHPGLLKRVSSTFLPKHQTFEWLLH